MELSSPRLGGLQLSEPGLDTLKPAGLSPQLGGPSKPYSWSGCLPHLLGKRVAEERSNGWKTILLPGNDRTSSDVSNT